MKNFIIAVYLLIPALSYSQNTFLKFYDIDKDKNQGITIEKNGDSLFVFDSKIGKYYSVYYSLDLNGKIGSSKSFNSRGYYSHLYCKDGDDMYIISLDNKKSITDTLFITKYQINGDSLANFILPIGAMGYPDASSTGFIKTPTHFVMTTHTDRTNLLDTIKAKASLWYLHHDFTVDTIIPMIRDDYTTPLGLQMGPDGDVYVFSYTACTENEFCDDYKPGKRIVSIFRDKQLVNEFYTEGYDENDIRIPLIFLVTKDTSILYGFLQRGRSIEPSIRCVDKSGKIKWEVSDQMYGQQRTYTRLGELSDGNIIALGYIEGEGYSRTAYIQKISKHGEVMWERIIGAHNTYDSDEYGSSGVLWRYVEDSLGYMYIIGKMGGPTSDDMVLMKVDSYGCVDEDRCNTYFVVNPLNGNHKYDQINLMQKEWYYTVTDRLGNQSIQHVTIGQDTILYDTINGNQKYKLLYFNSAKDHYSLRWDAAGKLYRMYDVSNPWEWLKRDTVIYDFTLKVGDKFKLPAGFKTAKVIQVDSIELLDGKTRKQIILQHENTVNQQKFGNLTWIEGIGSPNGILYYNDWINGTSTTLNCYYDRRKKRFGHNLDCAKPNLSTNSVVNPDYEWVVDYIPFVSIIDRGIRTYSFSSELTQINGKLYNQLNYKTLLNSSKIGTNEYYREENNVVLKQEGNSEIVLIDFNFVVGDSISYTPFAPLSNLVITQIDSVKYKDNKYRKQFKLYCLNDEQDYYWIEGLGSFPNSFNRSSCTILDVASLQLRCFYEDGIQIYQDSLIFDCLISSSEDFILGNQISLQPNPISSNLIINSKLDIDKLTIFNSVGESVYSTYNVNEVDLSFLSDGLYYVEFELNSKKKVMKKVMKL